MSLKIIVLLLTVIGFNVFADTHDKEVIATFVSWKTPLGSLNSNRHWFRNGYYYNIRSKKTSANYMLAEVQRKLPAKPLEIGSPEYMKYSYEGALEQLKFMKKAGIDVMLYDCMPLPRYNPAKKWTYDNIPFANYGMLPVWLKAAGEVKMKIGIFIESHNGSGDYPNHRILSAKENIKLFKAVLHNLPQGDLQKSLWKINGLPVIMHFATDSCMGYAPDKKAPAPDGGWREVISKLRNDGEKFYFIADIRSHTPNRHVWSKIADAVYDFSPAGPGNFLTDTSTLMKKYFDKLGTPYIFSVSPGYYNRKAYTEPDFSRIHSLYMAAMKNDAQRVHIMTWNDTVEDTDIAPSANKGKCLVDIFSFYNEWFKSGNKPVIKKDNITLAYPKVISQNVTSKALKWGGGRWVGQPYSPKVFYWAALKAPRTVKVDGAGTVKLPAGLSMGEFPAKVTVCDKLKINVDDKVLSYPGIKPYKKELLQFKYVNLINDMAVKK